MSFFRNYTNVVSSQLFTRPNNLILKACFRPIYLQTAIEENIDYLHSSKALLTTIAELKKLQGTSSGYQKAIESDISLLESNIGEYGENIAKYVMKSGPLTGEGIGNIYYGAQMYGITPEWLERNVHHEVPRKYQYMTRQNLSDTLAGLQKYHPSSPYISQVQERLASIGEQDYQHVNHLYNETTQFQYVEKGSSNMLIHAIVTGMPGWQYSLRKILNDVLNQARYALHSQ